MTRVLTCGWETGDLNEASAAGNQGGNTGTSFQNVVSTVPTPRLGNYCYKLGGYQYAGNGTAWRQLVLAAPKSEIWLRCAVYLHSPMAYSTAVDLLNFFDANNTWIGYIYWSETDRLIRGSAGAAFGPSTLQLDQDRWHVLEVHWLITSTTVGTTEVWVDGTRWINAVGIDNTSSGLPQIQRVTIGSYNNAVSWGGGPNFGYMAYDDLAINDTLGTINNGQVGDGRVVLIKPSGAGTNTNQSRGGLDTGANWSQVSEMPPSTSQYVYSSVPGTRDTYALDDLPAGTWTVNSVELVAMAHSTDIGTASVGLTVKSGPTTNEGPPQNLALGAQQFRQLYETDPNTGAAWTVAAVNALEAGTTVE